MRQTGHRDAPSCRWTLDPISSSRAAVAHCLAPVTRGRSATAAAARPPAAPDAGQACAWCSAVHLAGSGRLGSSPPRCRRLAMARAWLTSSSRSTTCSTGRCAARGRSVDIGLVAAVLSRSAARCRTSGCPFARSRLNCRGLRRMLPTGEAIAMRWRERACDLMPVSARRRDTVQPPSSVAVLALPGALALWREARGSPSRAAISWCRAAGLGCALLMIGLPADLQRRRAAYRHAAGICWAQLGLVHGSRIDPRWSPAAPRGATAYGWRPLAFWWSAAAVPLARRRPSMYPMPGPVAFGAGFRRPGRDGLSGTQKLKSRHRSLATWAVVVGGNHERQIALRGCACRSAAAQALGGAQPVAPHSAGAPAPAGASDELADPRPAANRAGDNEPRVSSLVGECYHGWLTAGTCNGIKPASDCALRG